VTHWRRLSDETPPTVEINFNLSDCKTSGAPSANCKGPKFLLDYAQTLLKQKGPQNGKSKDGQPAAAPASARDL
jgi:hypothetical protein